MPSTPIDDQGPTILAVCWILVSTPALIVILRMYCKVRLNRGFGWDDLVICLALVLLLVYTGLTTRGVQMGVIGKHAGNIDDPSKIPGALKLIYIGMVIAIISCVLSKTSFAITLLRIVTSTWQKAILWFIIISMNIIMWLCAICYLLQCKPTEALWNSELMPTADCWPSHIFETIALTAGAYSGCMDFILALLPWLVIWKLQMRRREKLGIAIAMSLGIFAAATAFIKTTKLTNVSNLADYTYACSEILIWASAETGLTIFAASIPSLRVLFVRMHSSYNRSDEPSSYNNCSNSAKKGRTRRRLSGFRNRDPYYCDEPITLPDRRDDNSSKSILSSPGIRQTQEIIVTYDQAPSENGSMGNRLDVRQPSPHR
ncbi:uncharacterized protein BDW43DRAFT_317861 [Aspergillus alliaceus]|uniref:uncharacterized protein n=1 Tax=Petromyces alliaceus TaxID=209559 RepID=UPI0012A5C51E|nr:uncharacterized protein BDW43DRAFT_317861 [Aspergillus alliaceus]KAB8235904.1 hypothetical protein BDW43DRAFT_317861 [Aspergillus alliaceus]